MAFSPFLTPPPLGEAQLLLIDWTSNSSMDARSGTVVCLRNRELSAQRRGALLNDLLDLVRIIISRESCCTTESA